MDQAKLHPELGLTPDRALDVAIIGAGFSGIATAYKLDKAGRHDFRIYELADRVGGTWRDNVYPGCACDVQSRLYSFSFARNKSWSEKYSGQAEIHRYLDDCHQRFKLESRTSFNTHVDGLTFMEDRDLWALTITKDGVQSTHYARHVAAATGPLRIPRLPDFKGLSGFDGPVFHSASWPQDQTGKDFSGKRVGIIGTGASVIQFLPEVAKTADHVAVFQRTPPWIVSRKNRRFTWLDHLLNRIPGVPELVSWILFWVHEALGIGFFRKPEVNRKMQFRALRHMRDQIKDPALRTKVTPDYVLGCKRVLLSDDYYPALARDTVDLITAALDHIDGNTLVGTDGTRSEVDVLIFGIGFEASEPLKDLPITGVGGQTLKEAWAEGAEAYMGTMVHGFPNLFILTGPNTGIGNTSVVIMSEAQADMINRTLDMADSKAASRVNVSLDAQKAFNDDINAKMPRTVWSTGCSSWYLNASGRNTTLWPDFAHIFRRLCRSVPASAFTFSKAIDRSADRAEAAE